MVDFGQDFYHLDEKKKLIRFEKNIDSFVYDLIIVIKYHTYELVQLYSCYSKKKYRC